MRKVGLLGFVVLLVLHQDFWLWDRSENVLGLPVGLAYHVGLCLVASAVFWAMTSKTEGEAET